MSLFYSKMKIIFAEARSREKISKETISKISFALPKRIGLFSSVQYLGQLKNIEKELKDKGHKIIIGKGSLSCYPGQILGCDISSVKKIKDEVDAFLIIGSRFHAIFTALKTSKPVFFYSEGKTEKISDIEIKKIKAAIKTAKIKLYSNNVIGILVSIKPGQEKLKLAEKIKEKLETLGKKGVIFLADNISISEFENFPINIYINTSCPTLMFDSNKIIDLSEIPELAKDL